LGNDQLRVGDDEKGGADDGDGQLALQDFWNGHGMNLSKLRQINEGEMISFMIF